MKMPVSKRRSDLMIMLYYTILLYGTEEWLLLHIIYKTKISLGLGLNYKAKNEAHLKLK